MKLFTAILTGMIGGFILGVLYAPKKGSETRRDIMQKGGEISDDIKLRFHQFGEFINEKLDSTKGIYQQYIKMRRSV
ncbi:MAG TPA: YtxH domain-containing protein [Bacteroidales bacterium]|nr:YtxH domain-containing protein [Bacteroidales bacterium]